jgi:hypothetical protein
MVVGDPELLTQVFYMLATHESRWGPAASLAPLSAWGSFPKFAACWVCIYTGSMAALQLDSMSRLSTTGLGGKV